MIRQIFCQTCRAYTDVEIHGDNIEFIRCKCGEFWAIKTKKVELEVFKVELTRVS